MPDSVWMNLLRKEKSATSFDYASVLRSLEHVVQVPPVERCSVALEFETKMHEIIFVSLGNEPTRGQIAQGKYLLQEQWQLWRRSLPFDHKDAGPVAITQDHLCLDHVYHDAYERLHLLELTLRPSSNLITDYEQVVRSSKEEVEQTIAGIVIADELPAE